MFPKSAISILATAAVLTTANVAFAATISGKINDSNNAGLAGMEVRLWTQGAKGWEIDVIEFSAADGTYSFTSVPAGEYKLDARMAPMVTGNYGDTWYDVAPPTSNGLVGADADIIAVADTDTLTGINLTLPVLGGLDARVVEGSTPLGGLIVRAESKQDPRIHHNDYSDGPCCGTNPHLGKAYFRGLAPSTMASTYRLLIYDFEGIYQTKVAPGPFTVTANSNANAGDVAVTRIPADPNEPNNAATDAGTPTLTMFPYSPSAVALAPRGDVDWYCLNAVAGERYVATVQSRIDVEGTSRPHPWFDPVIGLWNGTQFVLTNDDIRPGETLDASLDTRALAADGRYCFVVTTFGDSTFAGTAQGTAGEYDLDIVIGNRQPTLVVQYEGADAPIAPMEIVVDEDVAMVFEVTFSDPDGDVLNLEVQHTDNAGATVTTGVLDQSTMPATYTWTPTQTDGALSPFELRFRVNDGEFDLRYPVVVRVSPVSVPPTVPVLLLPEDEATVASDTADLVLENSTDADGDALSYDFQVEFGEPDGMPELEANEMEDASGQTSTSVTGLPENSWVSWRARAFDGADYSAWSEWRRFLVDANNEPPDVPVIVKPQNNEQLAERQVTIAATVPADPEGDAVTVSIELARDGEFEDMVDSSSAIEPGTDEMMIDWLVEQPLEFGNVYYARAFAEDDRGARSEYSAVVAFSIRYEDDLVPPSFSGEFASCMAMETSSGPTEIQILNIDNSGDAVTFEVSIVAAGTSEALATAEVAQSDDVETTVELEGAPTEPGEYLVRVRATRGDETTSWTECPFTIPGGEDPGDGPGDDDSGTQDEGCGCGTTGGAPLPGLFLLGAFLVLRRRKRRKS